MKKKLIVLGFVLSLLLVVVPAVSLAQNPPVAGTAGNITTGQNSTFTCQPGAPLDTVPALLCRIGQILNSVIPVLIALGVVYFVWGVVSYVIASDEEAKKTGRDRIIYGIIGLAVIISVWGLVGILVKTFVPTGNTQTIKLPTI